MTLKLKLKTLTKDTNIKSKDINIATFIKGSYTTVGVTGNAQH